jgi:hypothetical protein
MIRGFLIVTVRHKMKDIKEALPPEGKEVLVKLKNGYHAVAIWTDYGGYYDWNVHNGVGVEGGQDSFSLCLKAEPVAWCELPNE